MSMQVEFWLLLIFLFVVPMFMPSFKALGIFLAVCLMLVIFCWPSLPADPRLQSGPMITRILIGMAGAAAMSGVILRAIIL